MRYVDRLQSDRLLALLKSFPAVLLVGPRQCGKSTLAQHVVPDWLHLDLDRQEAPPFAEPRWTAIQSPG